VLLELGRMEAEVPDNSLEGVEESEEESNEKVQKMKILLTLSFVVWMV